MRRRLGGPRVECGAGHVGRTQFYPSNDALFCVVSRLVMARTSPSAHTLKSLAEFISWLEETFPDGDDVLFRGQREDWPMLPKIARLQLRPKTTLLETEQRLLGDFKLQAPSFVNLLPDTDWDWLSLAQHYGMATRLLDWTSNPLAALWFAVEKPAVTNGPRTKLRPLQLFGHLILQRKTILISRPWTRHSRENEQKCSALSTLIDGSLLNRDGLLCTSTFAAIRTLCHLSVKRGIGRH
jgi:hypothetical protein